MRYLPLLLAWAASGFAQPAADNDAKDQAILKRDDLNRAARSIDGTNILRHVKLLCGDQLAGREAGSKGARAAAEYIAEEFRKLGLQPGGGANGFYQSFKIRAGYRIRSELYITGADQHTNRLVRVGQYMPAHIPTDTAGFDGEIVFGGFGISAGALAYDDFARVNPTNKAVLVFAGAPWGQEMSAWLRRAGHPAYGSLAYKARNAGARGAKLLLVVDDPADWRARDEIEENLRLPNLDFPLASPVPVVHLTRDAAASLASVTIDRLRSIARETQQRRKPRRLNLHGRRMHYIASITGTAAIGRNVIAVLPGADRRLRHEGVVLGAHYDHLGDGMEGYFPGANDNAGGVGALLEIARAFTGLDARPKRTLIFIAFGAEEIGRMGSLFYVDRPYLPMRDTVMMINFDMIGRNDPGHIFAVGTRTSRDLHLLHQAANNQVGLRIEHPPTLRLGRSDHSSFYMANVPIMYLFGGRHEGYHSIHDTPDLLVVPKLGKVARLAFLTASVVAERPRRLHFGDTPVARPE